MKRLLFALILVFAATPGLAQETRIAAVVNDDVISMADLAARMRLVFASSRLDDTQQNRQRLAQQVLRVLVDEKLEVQEAKRLNITVPEGELNDALAHIEGQNNLPKGALDQYLASHGIDRTTVVNQITATLAWGKVVRQNLNQVAPVSDEEIEAALARLREEEGQPRAHVAEIYLSVDNPQQDEEVHRFADRLYEQLRGGADFAAVAQQFSRSATAAVGGDLGWMTPSQLGSEIGRTVQGMAAGELSPPIHGPGGYYLVLVLAKQAAGGNAGADTVVALIQVMFPLAADAPEAERQRVAARAQAIGKDAKSCGELAQIGRREAPQTSGDLGRVKVGDLPEALRQTVLGLKVAEASPPVPLRGGIGVLMVCEREESPAALPNHDQMADLLFRDRFESLARRYLRDLRRLAFVDVRG